MRKDLGATCLMIVWGFFTLAMLGFASQSLAQPNVSIHVNRNQKTISFTPKYLGVCKSKTGNNCDSTEFKWKLADPLRPKETLTIANAPNHLRCFSATEKLFEKTNNTNQPMPDVTYNSGPPQEACAADKYGTYWPYVVTLTLPDGTEIISDPGGIIHP